MRRTLSQALVLEVELFEEVLLATQTFLFGVNTRFAGLFAGLTLASLAVAKVTVVALCSAVFAIQEGQFRVGIALGAAGATQILAFLAAGRAGLALEVLEESPRWASLVTLLVVQDHGFNFLKLNFNRVAAQANC